MIFFNRDLSVKKITDKNEITRELLRKALDGEYPEIKEYRSAKTTDSFFLFYIEEFVEKFNKLFSVIHPYSKLEITSVSLENKKCCFRSSVGTEITIEL